MPIRAAVSVVDVSVVWVHVAMVDWVVASIVTMDWVMVSIVMADRVVGSITMGGIMPTGVMMIVVLPVARVASAMRGVSAGVASVNVSGVAPRYGLAMSVSSLPLCRLGGLNE